MKTSTLAPAVLGLVLLAAGPARPQAPAVAVNIVKYDGLRAAVLQHRGKVVVVDFWADTCLPCKQNMPHLVELCRKHAAQGLALITVSLDEVQKDPAIKGKLERFLTKQNATFTNLLLDEPVGLWQQRLRFDSIPTVFVFDRRGRWVQFTGDTFDPAAIDRLVGELLMERP